MRLSTKLSLAMGTLTLVIAVMGTFNIYQMKKINDAAATLADNWMPAIVSIEEVNTIASNFRLNETQHVYTEDEALMAQYENNMRALSQEGAARRKTFETLISSPEEQALYQQYRDSRNQYVALNAKVLELSRQMKTKEAVDILYGQSHELYVKMSEAITKLVKYNLAGGRKAAAVSDNAYNSAKTLIFLLLAAALLMAVGLSTYIVRATLRQLGKDPQELGNIARQVAAGDLNLKNEGHPVGVYADILVMVDHLRRHIDNAHLESENARKESERARKAMEEAELSGQEAQAKTASLLKAADQLEQVTAVLSSASEQLAAQVTLSEQGASEQAARVSETATAMEEMNCTVLEVARSAGQASDLSARTRQKADEGAVVVQRVIASITAVQQQSQSLKEDMATLGTHAQSINDIMRVISDIADQTNLLALNAAIEAARAGEAGRGFAVVADEVRKLAEKTMASTADVGNAIKAIQTSAEKNIRQVDTTVGNISASTELATQSGHALQEIVQMVDEAADQVRAIATASEEQSATSEEINRSINQVNTIANDTALAMRDAAHAVSDLTGQVQVLGRLIDDMKK